MFRARQFSHQVWYCIFVFAWPFLAHAAPLSISFEEFEDDVLQGRYRRYHDEGYRVVRLHFSEGVFRFSQRLTDAILTLKHQGYSIEGVFSEGELAPIDDSIPQFVVPIASSREPRVTRRNLFQRATGKIFGAPATFPRRLPSD